MKTATMKHDQKTQRGFSLVELMIAMVLGLVLMAGVLQVFITSKQTYNLNEEMTWIQENARYAVNFLAEDVRMAGYYGCASRAANVVNVLKDADSKWVTDFDKGIFGYDGNDASFPTAVFPRPATATLPAGLPKTDVITVHRADLENSLKVTGHNANSAVIDIKGTHDYDPGTILIVTDCSNTAIFQTTGNQSNKVNHNAGGSIVPGNCVKGLGRPRKCTGNAIGNVYPYKDDAEIMRAIGSAYYVDVAANGVPSLFRESLNTGGITTAKEELIQGVENIQIQYGLDTDNDNVPNRYVNANQVTAEQWVSSVVSARITLLLRSQLALASEPQTFSYMGASYTPTDKYVRRVFSTTVKLRNRGM